jgi:hypothetical protein
VVIATAGTAVPANDEEDGLEPLDPNEFGLGRKAWPGKRGFR